MKQKKTFKTILAILAISIAILPLLVIFNEVLTKFFETLSLYRWIENLIVPRQAAMVGFILSPFDIDYSVFRGGMIINGDYVHITWNCIGWQGFIVLIATLIVGLKGKKYTGFSVIETIIFGLVGTMLVNLLRMSILILLYVYATKLSMILFHNYFAAIMTMLWLAFFWWFSYYYLLEENN